MRRRQVLPFLFAIIVPSLPFRTTYSFGLGCEYPCFLNAKRIGPI
jgi:hypothetical protein